MNYKEILSHTRNELRSSDPNLYKKIEEAVDLDSTPKENLLEYLDEIIEVYEAQNNIIDEIMDNFGSVADIDDVAIEDQSLLEMRVDEEFFQTMKEVRKEVRDS